jgi:hypothetical protein
MKMYWWLLSEGKAATAAETVLYSPDEALHFTTYDPEGGEVREAAMASFNKVRNMTDDRMFIVFASRSNSRWRNQSVKPLCTFIVKQSIKSSRSDSCHSILAILSI